MADASETTALVEDKGEVKDESFRRLKAYQPWAFFVTFGGYFMAHFSRKCYSTVKKPLETEALYDHNIVSSMDAMFMGTYAIGNIVSGKLGDTFNPITILAIGLFGSGACLLFITVAILFDFRGYSAALGNVFILAVYFLFGFFQSTGGPVGTAVMGNWFCDRKSIEKRGLIFGLWTCHQYCGDVTAQFCTAAVLAMNCPYWWALVIPAATNVLWGILTLNLVGDPADVGIVTEEVRIRLAKLEAARAQLAEGEVLEDTGPKPITYAAALRIPMVLSYALAFGFFKFTNYTLFFWLPYFLEERHFGDVAANIIASAYSIGMMPGGIITGVVSDFYGGRRAAVIGTFMCLLFVLLFIFSISAEKLNTYVLLVMLALMGILVGGPNNIITSAVAADLASHPSVRGNNKSLGTVTGLINGTGAIIASLGLLVIGPISGAFGWSAVWVFLMFCTAAGTALMSPKIYSELFPPKTEAIEAKTEIV